MNSIKKILHLSTIHRHYDNRVVQKFSLLTKRNGFNTILVIVKEAGMSPSVCTGCANQVIFLKKRGLLSRLLFGNWMAIFKALKEKPTVIHIHNPELLPFMVIVKLMKPGLKILFDMEENTGAQILDKAYLPKWTRKPISWFYGKNQRLAERVLDGFTVAEGSYLKTLKHPSRAIVVKNYPLIPPESNIPSFDFRKNPFRLVYVGGITRIRGAFTMVEVASLLHSRGYPVELLLIGPFENRKLQNEVLQFAESNGFPKGSLLIKGPMPIARAMDLIRESHLGLALLYPVPNYLESLPTKLFEYYLAEKPVVVSNFPLWESVVKKAECGEVADPLDINRICQQIELYVQDRERCRREGKRGKTITLELWNFETEFRKVVDLYMQLSGEQVL